MDFFYFHPCQKFLGKNILNIFLYIQYLSSVHSETVNTSLLKYNYLSNIAMFVKLKRLKELQTNKNSELNQQILTMNDEHTHSVTWFLIFDANPSLLWCMWWKLQFQPAPSSSCSQLSTSASEFTDLTVQNLWLPKLLNINFSAWIIYTYKMILSLSI